MGAGAMHDIAEHTTSLIPLADHTTVSALSCTAQAYRGLFIWFMRVNDIVDVRGLALDADITYCDRFHGQIIRTMTVTEWVAVRFGFRAYVPRMIERFPIMYLMRFTFGQLISWGTPEFEHTFMTIADVPLSVSYVWRPDARVCIWLKELLPFDTIRPVATCALMPDGEWRDELSRRDDSLVKRVLTDPTFPAVLTACKAKILRHCNAK
jgi:hypothetical protein